MRFSVWRRVVLTLLAFSVGACAQKPPTETTSPTALPVRLAAVDAVPKEVRPSWIASYGPNDTAKAGSQIRIIFRDDVIPLESLEAPDRTRALGFFTIAPALPGRFTFLTPRMVGFQADAPIPPATRVRVTLGKGLGDLHGHALDADFTWTFDTGEVALTSNLTVGSNATITTDLSPTIVVTSSAELDPQALVAHARIIDDAEPRKPTIALVRKPQPSPSPSVIGVAPGSDSPESFSYALTPERALDRARTYRFEIAPGLVTTRGNLPMKTGVVGHFQTYHPLALANVVGSGLPDVVGASGRFASGTPSLTFTNGLDANSAAKAISIDPAPARGTTLVHVTNGDATVTLNPYALRPRTHYTIAIAGELRDKYGQTLGAATNASFDTGPLAGDIWAPAGFSIFPSSNDLALDITTTNVRDGRYRETFRTLTPEDVVRFDPTDFAALEKRLGTLATWSPVSAPSRDRAVPATIPLRAKLGARSGLLLYGIGAETNAYVDNDGKRAIAQKSIVGAVQLTNIGIFAQWFPGGGLVRAHRLSDGTPIAGARIAIYPTGDAKTTSVQTCATGVTDARGTLDLDGPAFARCNVTSLAADRAPQLLVIARVENDWAFVRTNESSGAYQFGVYAGWSAGAPIAHGTIASDRNLYQPGETAYFTGVSYFDTNGVLARGRAAAYRVAITAPSGAVTKLGERSLDAFGAFTLAIPLERRAEVGYYTVQASAPNGEALEGSFRVAEFKPPNFKVTLAIDRAYATPGQTVDATWTSTYLFGATVDGGNARVDVTRTRAYFVPPGHDGFAFGRMWSYPDEEPTLSSEVLQADSKIGSDGKSAQRVTVPNDLPYPATYRIDAQTTDVSNLSVSDSKSFTALPTGELIGVRSEFVGTAGKAHEVAVIVTDPEGKALEGRHVRVVLQARSYASATQLIEGSETPKNAVHYRDVASVDLRSAGQAQKVTLTPPDAGSYRIRANFVDASNEISATDTDVWVSGSGDAAWLPGATNALTLNLDKSRYAPGDTATVLVQSPYPQAELLLAVVRHGVIYRKVLPVSGSAPQVRFTVTPEMLPNAAVEAVLVRRGAPLEKGVPRGLDMLSRIGMAPFDVALDAKYLRVTVKPQITRAEPQVMQHITLHVADRAGHGVRTELALAVVNDAILQLSGYRFPDLVKTVYAQQPISTRFADNRADVKLVSPAAPLEKGFGYGGGFERGAAGTRVRTEFKPIAFYDAKIVTDASGDATVSFRVPDDLTTWRVMAMAFSADARFGNGEATFVATKPLVTNAILPQFVRPGDVIRGGLSVTDTTLAKGIASIAATLEGDLVFSPGPSPQATTLEAPIDRLTQAFRFEIRATGTRASHVKFATKLGALRDAFSVPLEIRTIDTLESVVQVGTTTDRTQVPLVVDAGVPTDLGGLEITLASSLLTQTQEAVRVTLEGDAYPFASSIASRIAVAADALLLERRYARTTQIAALQKHLAIDLDALRALALPGGGYAPWPGARNADTYSSAFCAIALARAKVAGENVDPDLAAVRVFLHSRLNDPTADAGTSEVPRAQVRLEALETLGILGDIRDDHLADIYALRDRFSYYEQIELARHLLRLPTWRSAGAALRAKLLERVGLTARAAAVNIPGSSIETATAGQAQLVGMLVDAHADATLVDTAFRALLARRGRDGAWPSPSDTAEAMDSVVAYAMLESSPPNFSATARVGQVDVSAAFRGFASQPVTQTIPMARLPHGHSDVALAKGGTGTLHYVVAYRYGVRGEHAGRYAGIRFERIVRAPNETSELAHFGLAAPSGPLALDAGRVYEIEDRITTDHPLADAIVTDPLPAGFEAVDASFLTSNAATAAASDNWEIDYQAIYRDRVLAFAHHLEAGVYAVHYLVRSVTPGTFVWPAGDVHVRDAPEDFGRTAAGTLTIR